MHYYVSFLFPTCFSLDNSWECWKTFLKRTIKNSSYTALTVLHLPFVAATSGWSWRWSSVCHSGTLAPDHPPRTHIGLKRMLPSWGSVHQLAIKKYEKERYFQTCQQLESELCRAYLTTAFHKRKDEKKADRLMLNFTVTAFWAPLLVARQLQGKWSRQPLWNFKLILDDVSLQTEINPFPQSAF